MNREWETVLLPPSSTILRAIQIIDETAMQIALIVDEEHRLLGTVTDGDIRRGILRGVSLEDPIESVMNPHPTVVGANDGRDDILALMKLKKIRHVPVLDEDYRVIGIETISEILATDVKDNWVVLMAGGLGSRLRPLTDDCPKPLLKIGNKPLLETILENFIDYGFRRFLISVNYRADMVKDYFGDGSRWGVDIRYLHETKRMGTAGALSLLPEKPTEPFFVMNGDLLTKVNFQHLLDFYTMHRSSGTMCVREFDYQIPYGVVNIEKDRLKSLQEKPIQKFFVNAGIYIIHPDVLDLIPKDTYFDMTSLFDVMLERDMQSTVFPIREYWIDIGHANDYERANHEYAGIFG